MYRDFQQDIYYCAVWTAEVKLMNPSDKFDCLSFHKIITHFEYSSWLIDIHIEMNDPVEFIWDNTKRSLYAILKWFIVALVARLAFIGGIIVLLIPPAVVFGLIDGLGLPIWLSIPFGIVGFIAAGTGLGGLLERIDPIIEINHGD